MHTIFMNAETSKTSDPHRVLLNLKDKTNLKRTDKYVLLSNLSIYCPWKNIKNSYKNNKFKTAPTWYENLELPDGILFYIRYSKLCLKITCWRDY